jgi:hypothetical protein
MNSRNTSVTQCLLCAFGLWLLSQQCGQCFYDPGQQRWINRDPLAGDPGLLAGHPRRVLPAEMRVGANLYEPMVNAPTIFVDSSGRFAIPYPIAIEWPVGTIVVAGSMLGAAAIYCFSTSDYDKAKRECIDQCSKSSLPTRDHGFSFFNCVQKCMEDAGFEYPPPKYSRQLL